MMDISPAGAALLYGSDVETTKEQRGKSKSWARPEFHLPSTTLRGCRSMAGLYFPGILTERSFLPISTAVVPRRMRSGSGESQC